MLWVANTAPQGRLHFGMTLLGRKLRILFDAGCNMGQIVSLMAS
jgi:hypothetical protein